MSPAEAGLHTDGAGGAQVTIEDPDLCGRYVAAIADVTVGPSPQWMQDRLLMCGVRPISNIVDITNYVMLETGQPMHAFDLAKMREGRIIVRRAKPGETMTTLDGKKRTLTPDMLVIADAECAEDIGGVMGGASSEISNSTKRIVFEAAYFFPAQIRSTSKTLGLKTEASSRFERGADRTAPPRAMKRALELLEKINAGTPEGDSYRRLPFAVSAEDDAAGSRAHRRTARDGRAGRCGRANPDVAGLWYFQAPSPKPQAR